MIDKHGERGGALPDPDVMTVFTKYLFWNLYAEGGECIVDGVYEGNILV